MWTTGSVIFLSSLSHSFFLRKTHFCRLCQFFSAFSPSWPPLRSLVAYPVGLSFQDSVGRFCTIGRSLAQFTTTRVNQLECQTVNHSYTWRYTDGSLVEARPL